MYLKSLEYTMYSSYTLTFLYVALYTLVFVCVSMCMSVSMLIWVWSEPAVMVVRGSSVFILYVCLKTCLTVLFLISTYMGMDG